MVLRIYFINDFMAAKVYKRVKGQKYIKAKVHKGIGV
jgi:hypothetical protein